jgi:hypothetical protein
MKNALASILVPALAVGVTLTACHRGGSPEGARSDGSAHGAVATTPGHAGATRPTAPVAPVAPSPTHGTAMPGTAPAPTQPVVIGPPPPRGTWLSIVYGGNGQGEIEPCG